MGVCRRDRPDQDESDQIEDKWMKNDEGRHWKKDNWRTGKV